MRYQLEMPITTERLLLGAGRLGDGLRHHGRERGRHLRVGQSLQARHDDRVRTTSASSGTNPATRRTRPTTTTSCPACRPRGVRALEARGLTWLLGTDPVFRGGYSMSFDALGTNYFTGNYGGNIGRTRTGNRSATSGTPAHGLRWLAGAPARHGQALPVGRAGAARRGLRAHAGRQRVDRHPLPRLEDAASSHQYQRRRPAAARP